MPHVVLTTPTARRDIDALRGKPLAAYVRAVKALRASGCEAGGYRLTGYETPWICCVHLYADWRMLIRFRDDDDIHVIAVGRHRRGRREDVYRRLMELVGNVPPAHIERTKPPCCGKPPDLVESPGEIDEYLDETKTVFFPDVELDEFLSGDREVDERIRRARR